MKNMETTRNSSSESKQTLGWKKTAFLLVGTAAKVVEGVNSEQTTGLVPKDGSNSQLKLDGQLGKNRYQDNSPASKLVESGQSLERTLRSRGYQFDEERGIVSLENPDITSYALEKPDVKSLILDNQTLLDAFSANQAVKEILATENRNLTIDDLRKPEVMNGIITDEPLMRTLLGNKEIINATLQDAAVMDLVSQDVELVATCSYALQQNKHIKEYCDFALQDKTTLRTIAENPDLMRINRQIEQNLHARGLVTRDTNSSCDPQKMWEFDQRLKNMESKQDQFGQDLKTDHNLCISGKVLGGVATALDSLIGLIVGGCIIAAWRS